MIGNTDESVDWKRLILSYGATLGIVGCCASVSFLLAPHVEPTNLAMIFLLGVALVASRFGQGEAIAASLLSVLVFDIAFVPPRGTFAVSDGQYLITFSVMLTVALLISGLALRLKEQGLSAAEREKRSESLYSLTRDLASSRSKLEIAQAAAREIGALYEAEVAVSVTRPTGLEALVHSPSRFEDTEEAKRGMEQCLLGEDSAFGVDALQLQLRGLQGPQGVLSVKLPRAAAMSSDQKTMLKTFANGLGLALERAQLAKESHEARLQAQAEKTRNALLSSISHDLRTPLTAIAGSASALIEQGAGELAHTIYQESIRLNLQVQNLLDITKLQAEEPALNLRWNSLEEIISASITRTRELMSNRKVEVEDIGPLPLLWVDGELLEKVFTNLLENAAKYTPSNSHIWIKASVQENFVCVCVEDDGPGIAAHQEESVFERFNQSRGLGLGLGLAICKAIVLLHKGKISVSRAKSGGAAFLLEMPLPAMQPEMPHG